MKSSKLFWVLATLALEMLARSGLGMGDSVSNKCEFQAVYNFGDSNSDTGGISAALSEVTSPNGETFFGHPSGRFCDGRLIIDFFAEQLKLPYLSPYLDSIGTNFSHGANFATGGSSIRPGGYSPFHLGIQVSQFIQFKARTTALYNKLPSLGGGKWPPFKANLPRPEDFSRALYTFDIGQNDLAYGFQTTTEQQTLISIPDILNQFSQAVHRLYKEGARIFWVHNTGPIGCLPYNVIYNAKPGNIDENGCVKSQNQVAQQFNYQLKNTISKLRTELPGSRLTYVDVYSAKYQLIATATRQAEYLGLPYLGAYLDSLGTNFAHGANFASAGSSVRPGNRSPFFLALQVSQFLQFKARTIELYRNSTNRDGLPNPDDFSKALYTFEIGQNDIIFGFLNTTEDQVKLTFPDVLNQFSQAIQVPISLGIFQDSRLSMQ